MDGAPTQTVSNRRGTSSHPDEDDDDVLDTEDDDDDIGDAEVISDSFYCALEWGCYRGTLLA